MRRFDRQNKGDYHEIITMKRWTVERSVCISMGSQRVGRFARSFVQRWNRLTSNFSWPFESAVIITYVGPWWASDAGTSTGLDEACTQLKRARWWLRTAADIVVAMLRGELIAWLLPRRCVDEECSFDNGMVEAYRWSIMASELGAKMAEVTMLLCTDEERHRALVSIERTLVCCSPRIRSKARPKCLRWFLVKSVWTLDVAPVFVVLLGSVLQM